ncbi:GntR family transcriptional regulator [Gemmatimonas sp.]|uniref:GntR family transcriptional regulator n=1 Tax=Gemmatimonas sp. TaxID=1962908 RepID=UPI003563ED97
MGTEDDLRIQQRHLWEQIAEELRRGIHSGKLEPGSRLITADLAARWGVSRGPVREALMALENEGIVHSTRRQGTVVGTPSALDLQAIFCVREALESAAGNVLCDKETLLSSSDRARLSHTLDAMDKAYQRGENAAAIKSDFTFHQLIVDLTGNSRFSAINKNMISQNTQHLKGLDPQIWPQVGWETIRIAHQRILDALLAGDLDSYRDAIFIHYRNSKARASMPKVTPASMGEEPGRLGVDPA